MKTFIAIFTVLFGMSLAAASNANLYQLILNDLSLAASDAPIVFVEEFFDAPETTADGKMQRGVVLYSAAGQASSQKNLPRAQYLIAEAKILLTSALPGLDQSQRVRCLYYLGMIAEKYEGNLTVARDYYQQAGGYRQAKQALARVNRLLR